MAFSMFRLISRKRAEGASRYCNWISRKAAAPSFLGARISTLSVLSDESVGMSPCLMLPPARDGGDMVHKFYSVAEKKIPSVSMRGGGGGSGGELPDDDAMIVGSSHGWLALFNERNCDLFLSNPISRRHIKLPPIHTLPIPEKNLSGGYGCAAKVIISCSPDEEDDCRAMMTFGPEHRLAFCWPRRSTEWTPIGDLYHENEKINEETSVRRIARVYLDYVYSSRQKRFFFVTENEDLECWDLGDPQSPRIEPGRHESGF